MRVRTAFAFLAVPLLALAAEASGQERLYRVEILVLTALDHGRQPQEVAQAGDYSAALDLLSPRPEGSPEEPLIVTTELPPGEATPLSGAGAGTSVPGGFAEPPEDELPACTGGVTQVTEMGPEMQEAWRRLRLGAAYRPLQYLSWQQPGDSPFPLLRVHDGEILFTEDPWAAWREADAAAALGGAEVPAPGPLPAPIEHFRLDGTAQLVRTRFLHLDLDLEWREAVAETASTELAEAPSAGADAAGAQSRPSAVRVFRLQQRRQVRTGQLEYFDSPVLAVLALVNDVSHLLPEPDPEEE